MASDGTPSKDPYKVTEPDVSLICNLKPQTLNPKPYTVNPSRCIGDALLPPSVGPCQRGQSCARFFNSYGRDWILQSSDTNSDAPKAERAEVRRSFRLQAFGVRM